MNRRTARWGFLGAIALLGSSLVLGGGTRPGVAWAAPEAAPLIPRTVLFGNPDRANPKISPDGKRLAYLRADDKDVMQVAKMKGVEL